MLASIVLSGLAIGSIYALIGITYNVMYSASRVFSFTADKHDGYPDSQVVMVEANSLKDGAFNLAPGYGT